MSKPWFGVKRYGFGWAPCSSEGWLSLILYVVALALTGTVVDKLDLSPWFICAGFLIETAALVWLTAVKNDGKPWRWRWGDDGAEP